MKDPFKVAAWSFIVVLALGMLLSLLGGSLSTWSILPVNYESLGAIAVFPLVYDLIICLAGVSVCCGFIALGKKFDNKFLVILSFVAASFIILHTFYLMFGGLVLDLPSVPTQNNYNVWLQDELNGPQQLGAFLLPYLMIVIPIVILSGILFGIALLRLRGKLRHAKTAAILNIIAGATTIIGIGFFLFYIAAIFEILLLFEASKKFKRGVGNK